VKRFEFKLGRLSRVRKAQEEIARAKWQAAVSVEREIEQHLEAASADIERGMEYQRQVQACVELDPSRVLHAYEAIQTMERRREQLRTRLDQAHEETEELRAPWQAVRTELEGLKRLEETARTEHRRERERVESSETDQVAIERATLALKRSGRLGA